MQRQQKAPRQTMLPRNMPRHVGAMPESALRLQSKGMGSKATTRVLFMEEEGREETECADMLEREGFKVLRASTRGEALEIARRDQPQLVIVDGNAKEGKQLAMELKLLPALARVPVVALSGGEGAANREGFAACVTKPLEREKFGKMIRGLLGDAVKRSVKQRRDRPMKIESPKKRSGRPTPRMINAV